VRDKAKVTINH